MAFNAKQIVADRQSASESMDVNEKLQQGKFTRSTTPCHDPLSLMGQGKLGHFKSGNLGTFMDQAPAGGEVGKS